MMVETEKNPIILLIRPTLKKLLTSNVLNNSIPPEISPIPNEIHTPIGIYPYPGIQRLILLSIPYIDENGSVGYAQMRNLYFDVVITTIANQLKLQPQEFVNSLARCTRSVIVGAIPVDKPQICYVNPNDTNIAISFQETQKLLPEAVKGS